MRHPWTLVCAGLASLAALVMLAACGGYAEHRAATTAKAPGGPLEPDGTAVRTTGSQAAPGSPETVPRAARKAPRTSSTAPKRAPTPRTPAKAKAKPLRSVQLTKARAQPEATRARPHPVVVRPTVPEPAPLKPTPLPAVPPQLLLGFQDDAGFRWDAGRQITLDRAADAGAAVIRTTADWSKIASTRPASARDAFDPAYRFDDLDELARNAQRRGIRLLLTLWGTPSWANGGAGHNHAPTKAADLGDFARAVADRYSGRHAGYPYVGLYTVWNEPNLQQFLTPQFDASGRAVAPSVYAGLFRAARAGIKAANPQALVAIGETSPRGRDTPTTSGVQQSESPGRFAQLLSKERPRLLFDAWAHHPYPTAPNLPPTQAAHWPNVTLSQIPQFEAALRGWFGRADVPIWITEYAYQTNPPDRLGVSLRRQADYLRQGLTMARSDASVRMLIWFTFRDSAGNPWHSGLYTSGGAAKPALASFTSLAWSIAHRNDTEAVSSLTAAQRIRLPALGIAYFGGPGTPVGLRYRVQLSGRTVQSGMAAARVQRDGTVVFKVDFRPRAGARYVLRVTGSDVNGNELAETRTLVATR